MCAIMGFSTKKLDKSEIPAYFDRTVSRGPDMSKIMDTGSGWLCFHRLAIMGQMCIRDSLWAGRAWPIPAALRPL